MSPFSQFAKRWQIRDVLVTFCLTLLLCILGWSALSNMLSSRRSPQIRSGLEAVKAGNVSEATALLDTALSEQPEAPEQYETILAECLRSRRWELAIRYGERAIQACKYAPDNVRAALYSRLANAYMEAKHPDWKENALERAQRALELAPGDPMMMNQYGYLLADTDTNLDDAEKLLIQSMKIIQPQAQTPEIQAALGMVQDSYGWLLYRRKKYPEAIAVFQEALGNISAELAESSELKVIYYHLGAAQRLAGNLEEARRALDIALHYDKNYKEAQLERKLVDHTPPPGLQTTPTLPAEKPAPSADKSAPPASGPPSITPSSAEKRP